MTSRNARRSLPRRTIARASSGPMDAAKCGQWLGLESQAGGEIQGIEVNWGKECRVLQNC